MKFLKEVQEQIDKVWEPVLKPPRTEISNDLLGYKFITVNNETTYKRADLSYKTFDNSKLIMTCYFQIDMRLKSIFNVKKSSLYGRFNNASRVEVSNEFKAPNIASIY